MNGVFEMIIGITGPIGSGKSTVAKLFSRYHFSRIDADEIAHELLKNSEIKNKIIKEFGNKILDKQKNIDRKKLGSIVFNDNVQLKKLNSIMHTTIIKEIKNKINKTKNKCGDDAKIIIDAPLLFETETEHVADKIIVVKSKKENIFKRLDKKFSKDQIEKILKAQMPLEDKIKRADFVIENNDDLKDVEKQVIGVIKKLNQK